MEVSIYIGKCLRCQGYGMLEVVINLKSKACSVMCDECFVEWENPEDALNNRNGFRDFDKDRIIRTAKKVEIKKQEWEKYIMRLD